MSTVADQAKPSESRLGNGAVVLDVAAFSRTPGGRYRSEGEWSGEQYREEIVEPHLRAGKRVIIDLDGPAGFTSSFLEELFGGLVRTFGLDFVRSNVEVRAVTKPSRLDRASLYIKRAASSS